MGRLFIVGSGPSLSKTPLHRLIGEESWGMGRINKIYPYTDWRPTRVFWSDNVWEETQADILEHLAEGYDFYCRPSVIDEFTGAYVPREKGRDAATWQTAVVFDERPDQVHTYNYCSNEHTLHALKSLPGNRPTSWRSDVEPGVYCKYGGTFQVALMHGVEEGYNPIYVVGADLGIAPGGMGATNNHFDPDYQVMEYDQRKADGKNRAYEIAHGMAREYAADRGIRIQNAGIGGHLQAYGRVDFDSLF